MTWHQVKWDGFDKVIKNGMKWNETRWNEIMWNGNETNEMQKLNVSIRTGPHTLDKHGCSFSYPILNCTFVWNPLDFVIHLVSEYRNIPKIKLLFLDPIRINC